MMQVRRIITVQGNEIDCALDPCNLAVATLDGTTVIEGFAVPIAFDPDVPPVPALELALTVDDASGAVATGTVTCNREAEAFIQVLLQQEKGGQTVFASGATDEPVPCTTTPTQWSASLTDAVGHLVGGQATYEAFGDAFDGFDGAFDFVTGDLRISGGPRAVLPIGEQPGETVTCADPRAQRGA